MKIALFIPSFYKYDAMGNDVLMMYIILKEQGYDVTIFAQSYDSSIEVNIKNISEAKSYLEDKNNIAIYHHGVYTSFFDDIINSKCYKIFRYHNITYPELFAGYDENAVEMCSKGREQMKGKMNAFDYFLSCSEFNNKELLNDFNVDGSKTQILPPFHRIEEWKNIQENIILKKKLKSGKTINILNVGRLSPNKNHLLLIKSFSDFIKYYKVNACLHLVGKIGPIKYYNEILECIKAEDIENKVILYTDGIAESNLKTLYKYSDMFIMTSLHEGFCVPIVEAMYFKLPIVSLNSTALNDTVGKNGVIIDKEMTIEFSSAIWIAQKYKRNLSMIAHNGYSRFSYKKNKSDFLQIINNIIKNKMSD